MPDRAWTLSQIEEALMAMPRPEFRSRLKADLLPHASPTVAAQLRVRNTADAIDFYVRAFGARELMRFEAGGRIPHAEIEIGDSVIGLGDASTLASGYPGPDELGGSPVSIRLNVDDPQAAVDRAIAAGARLFLPVTDHFYGHRTGSVVDPFGYRWALNKVIEDVSVDEMHRRTGTPGAQGGPATISVTPYIVVRDADALVEFTRATFGAEQLQRAVGPAGGLHCEIRIGDSVVMIGGGAPDLSWHGEPMVTALHVYVPDVDAAFERARRAGATVDHAPRDMDYGERGAGVVDPAGNRWYIATAHGEHHVPSGLHDVNVYLQPLRAEPLMRFMARAFDAVELEKFASPDGVIHHAKMQVGESIVEMADAHGPYQPMPTMFLVQVADAEKAYRRALDAGGRSLVEPVDRPYGRTAAVTDPFGNQWHVSSQIRADKP